MKSAWTQYTLSSRQTFYAEDGTNFLRFRNNLYNLPKLWTIAPPLQTTQSSLTAIKWTPWKAHYGPPAQRRNKKERPTGWLLEIREDNYWVNPSCIHMKDCWPKKTPSKGLTKYAAWTPKYEIHSRLTTQFMCAFMSPEFKFVFKKGHEIM